MIFDLAPPAGGSATWTETVLYKFKQARPVAGPLFGPRGNLYVLSANAGAYGFGAAFDLEPPSGSAGSWTKRLLFSFNPSAGFPPTPDGLLVDPAGRLFGTTYNGGPHICADGHVGSGVYQTCGTVFRLKPEATGGATWTKTPLHKFPASTDDGILPTGSLVVDPAGNLYGTTRSGGTSNAGTVFELHRPAAGTSHWKRETIYSFTRGEDGIGPNGVILDASFTHLYGTTNGIDVANDTATAPTAFELTRPATDTGSWAETTIWTFKAPVNGGLTYGNLVINRAGNLYGMTSTGTVPTAQPDPLGDGSIYELSPPASGGTAWSYSTRYAFAGSTDGAEPVDLILDATGTRLYGMTATGAVFELSLQP